MKKSRSFALVAGPGIVLTAALSWAAPSPGPAGHWMGAIETPGQALPVEVDLVAKAEGTWAGTITIAVQNLRAFPLSEIQVQRDAVSFAMKGIPGDPLFKGRLSADGGSLSGEFTQGGARLPFQLKRTGEATLADVPKSTPVTQEVEGSWEGSLSVGGTVLRLELKLENHPEGGATGHVVSVDQGRTEIGITTIRQTASRLELHLPSIGASYSGELKEGRLVGEWTQGPGTSPLVFSRAKP